MALPRNRRSFLFDCEEELWSWPVSSFDSSLPFEQSAGYGPDALTASFDQPTILTSIETNLLVDYDVDHILSVSTQPCGESTISGFQSSDEFSAFSSPWSLHLAQQTSPGSQSSFVVKRPQQDSSAVSTPIDKVKGEDSAVQLQQVACLTSERTDSQTFKQPAKSCGRKRKAESLASRQDVLSSDPKPQKMIKKDVGGNVQGTFSVYGASKIIRSSFNAEDRRATALTRKRGVCEKCRRHKTRCNMPDNPYQPCGKCASLALNIIHDPCIRVDILEVNLHRLGSTLNNSLQEWTTRKLELDGLSRLSIVVEPPRTISLTQEIGVTLEVTVSRFHPEPGDATTYHWVDPEGRPRKLDMPPYYISDMSQALQNIQDYGRRSYASYIDSLLESTNPIIWRTFDAACGYVTVSTSSLVSDALSFWAATRLTERTWRICGEDTLGVQPSSEPGNPWNGIVPVTPVMDTQLDELAIRSLLLPLKEKVLIELNRKINEKKRENWFEIFLTTFIIMSNVEWILSDVIDYTSRHGMTPRSRGKPSLTKGYVHACKTLLAYFHFACDGAAPLKINWEKPQDNANLMTLEQLTYLQGLQKEVARQEGKLEGLKDVSMYQTEMYWCFQTLSKQWRADMPHAGPSLEFTEEDFLTS